MTKALLFFPVEPDVPFTYILPKSCLPDEWMMCANCEQCEPTNNLLSLRANMYAKAKVASTRGRSETAIGANQGHLQRDFG